MRPHGHCIPIRGVGHRDSHPPCHINLVVQTLQAKGAAVFILTLDFYAESSKFIHSTVVTKQLQYLGHGFMPSPTWGGIKYNMYI